MALTIENSPYIFVYRNSICFVFANKAAVQTAFDIDSDDYYLKFNLKNLNTDVTTTYYGNSTSIPTTASEGLNQLDLSLTISNGVYELSQFYIIVGGSQSSAIDTSSPLFDFKYNAPSIKEFELNLY